MKMHSEVFTKILVRLVSIEGDVDKIKTFILNGI